MNGVGFVASSGVHLGSRDRRLALHVCDQQVQRRQKKVRKHALPTFLSFGFVWQMKDFVTGDVRKR